MGSGTYYAPAPSQSAAQVQSAVSVPPVFPSQADSSQNRIRRSEHVRSDIESSRVAVRTVKKLPLPLTILLVLAFLLAVSLWYASGIMQGYLDRQAQARIDAHQALLDSHPYNYESMIRRHAGEYNLQSAFVAAIILNESSFNPRATSSVGARGLMQLMPDTAQWIAGKLGDKTYSFENMYDPDTNIRYGCWYLNYLSGLFYGDPVSVTAAYHAGQGTVRNWLQDGRYSADGGHSLSLTAMPEGPTKNYARRVTHAYALYDALYDHVLNPVPDSAHD